MGVFRNALVVAAVASAAPFIADRLLRREFPVPQSGAVVITGTSSGIGKDACIRVALDTPLTPFCGVRKMADGDALVKATGGKAKVLLLDVSSEEQILAARDAVRASGLPLVGLVNNAGIATQCPLEVFPMGEVRKLLEVNYFGLVRTTQVMLPDIKASQGRVVHVGSVVGVAHGGVGGAVYSSSKAALERLSDSLRAELKRFNVSVSLLQPGAVKSQIMSDPPLKPEGWEAYRFYYEDPQVARVRAIVGDKAATPGESTSKDIVHALTSPYPKARYMSANVAGVPAWVFAWIFWFFPDVLTDHMF